MNETGTTFDIRPYRAGDESGILASFNAVFREVCGDDFVDRGIEFWNWEFRDNPDGHRISLAATADGTVAAHYGGAPYRMATAYGELIFVHIVDSFVHPDYRRGLKRPGLFVQTALPWFEECFAQGDAVLYGYPVPAAERVGQRYMEYKRLRVVDYLCRDASAGSTDRPNGIDIERLTRFDAEADTLFDRLRDGKQCWTLRNARYLNWRWVEIPGDDYEIWAARRDGELSGLMVLRPIHELAPDSCTIGDWLVDPDDDETSDALLAVATERAGAHQRGRLLAVFADPSPEYARLCRSGFSVEPSSNWLERRLTHRIYHPDLTSEWLGEHWWYTLGDSDLV